MSKPFCDYFALSTPRDDGEELMSNLRPVIEVAGGYEDMGSLYRFPGGGTIKTHRRGQVFVVGTSGQALSRLRAAGLFQRYLWGIVESPPTRVTSMHATVDIEADAPVIVRRLFKRARKGLVHLSRKAVKPENIEKRFGIDARGNETGTVYLGKRTSEAWGKVYDKRHERECRGVPDPGPLLRVEIAVTSKMGVTLKDVDNPEAVFYHFASPDLVEKPAGCPEWVSGDTSLKLPPKIQLLPAQQLNRLLTASPDIRRALELAEQIGPRGVDYLYRKLDQMLSQAACVPR